MPGRLLVSVESGLKKTNEQRIRSKEWLMKRKEIREFEFKLITPTVGKVKRRGTKVTCRK